MKLTDFLENIGRPVAYYPGLRQLTGSTNATILLCQFIYWRGKESDPDGWLYKQADEIEKETGLSYEEQKNARAKLVEAGLIQEHYARLDHQMKFLVNLDAINEKWGTRQQPVPEHGKATFGKTGLPHSLNSITETTTETTTKQPTAGDYQKFSQKVTDERKEMLKLGERIEASLGITPDWKNKKWERTVREMVRKEAAGQSFDRFVKWLRSGNEYNRPKPFQIAKDPGLILNNWAQAFMSAVDSPASVTRNDDGSLYV